MNMTIYSSEICSGCRRFKAEMEARGLTLDYVDICANVPNMRAFLKLRDELPIFDAVRARGGIGIPLFVREDGVATHDENEALAWIGQPPMPAEEEACPSCK